MNSRQSLEDKGEDMDSRNNLTDQNERRSTFTAPNPHALRFKLNDIKSPLRELKVQSNTGLSLSSAHLRSSIKKNVSV